MNFTQMTGTMFRAMELPFLMTAGLMDAWMRSSDSGSRTQWGNSDRQWSSRGHRSRRSRQRARARARQQTAKAHGRIHKAA